MDVYINGYIDREKFAAYFACQYGPNLLISSLIQYEGRGKAKGWLGYHFFSQQLSMKVHANLVQHPINNKSIISVLLIKEGSCTDKGKQ